MEQFRLDEEGDPFDRQITSDSDPQLFDGIGERVKVTFHSQDLDRLPGDTPLYFICESDPSHKRFNRFREITPDVSDPVTLLHRKRKPISPANFYEPEALWPGRRAKQVAAAAAAAAGGLALLAIKRRKQ